MSDGLGDGLGQINKHITLIGMMGAGKSHIGKLLAKYLDMNFVDTDDLIEQKAGCTIAEIFERDGEAFFRQAEHNTILEVLKSQPAVIATGGGAVTHPDSFAAMLSGSVCVYLKADLETLWNRVKNNTSRPLLQNDNPKKILENLLNVRRSLYEQAHITVEAQAMPPKRLAAFIAQECGAYRHVD